MGRPSTIASAGRNGLEAEHQGYKIHHYEPGCMKGPEFVGMSSVGPSTAIITEKTRLRLRRSLKAGVEIAIETRIDNKGPSSPTSRRKLQEHGG